MKSTVKIDTPDGVVEMNEVDVPLDLQVAIAFAEASLEYGHMVEPDDFHEVELAQKKSAKMAERRKVVREEKRIRRLRTEQRACKQCGIKFRVVTGDWGTVKAYCSPKCRKQFELKQRRENRAKSKRGGDECVSLKT